MAKKETIIALSDIKCEEIVNEIKEATSIIVKFTTVLSNHLEYKPLQEAQIFIVRSETNSYEDDGNTKTPGYEYEVYWCFPYINVDEEVDIYRLTSFESYMWPHTLLFFKLSLTERIKDNSLRDGHHFHLFVTEEAKKETKILQIAWYNDNHKLSNMLDSENLQQCTDRINETYRRIVLKQEFLEELCEIEEVDDVEEYINKNCKL